MAFKDIQQGCTGTCLVFIYVCLLPFSDCHIKRRDGYKHYTSVEALSVLSVSDCSQRCHERYENSDSAILIRYLPQVFKGPSTAEVSASDTTMRASCTLAARITAFSPLKSQIDLRSVYIAPM